MSCNMFNVAIPLFSAGLKWLRSTHGVSNCDGVVYFSDDYTKLNIKLFNKVSYTLAINIDVDTIHSYSASHSDQEN